MHFKENSLSIKNRETRFPTVSGKNNTKCLSKVPSKSSKGKSSGGYYGNISDTGITTNNNENITQENTINNETTQEQSSGLTQNAQKILTGLLDDLSKTETTAGRFGTTKSNGITIEGAKNIIKNAYTTNQITESDYEILKDYF